MISPDDKLLFKGVKLVIVDGIGVQTTNKAIDALIEKLGLDQGVKRLAIQGEDVVRGDACLVLLSSRAAATMHAQTLERGS